MTEKTMTRPIIRHSDDTVVDRYRLSRLRSVRRGAYGARKGHKSRMDGWIFSSRSALRTVVNIGQRFASGNSSHRIPNPFMWARIRISGGSKRYDIKARKLPPRKITGTWFAKAGYPLRGFGRGAKGGNRSVSL